MDGSSTRQSFSLSESAARLQAVIRDVIKRNEGLLLISFAQLFFVSMNTVVKMLSSLDTPVPTAELITVRMVITFVCSIGWMTWAGVPHPVFGPPEVRRLLLLRGFVGFVSLYGLYNGLRYLSLSDATIIMFLSPSLTALEAWFFLKEQFPRREAAAGLVSLVGVIFIARPDTLFGSQSSSPMETAGDLARLPTSAQRIGAIAVSLFAVVMGSAVFVILRLLGSRCHPMHTLAYFAFNGLTGGPLAAFLFGDRWIVPSLGWLGGMLLVGTCGFTGQYLVVLGLQKEAAGRGALGEYTQIIFALILERLFFKVLPSGLSLVGGSLILGSALYIVLMNKKLSDDLVDEEDSSVRLADQEFELEVSQ